MSGPWEKYQQSSGPWNKYLSVPPPVPPQPKTGSVMEQLGAGLTQGAGEFLALPGNTLATIVNGANDAFNPPQYTGELGPDGQMIVTPPPPREPLIDPQAGTKFMEPMIAPFLQGRDPQTIAQRFSRSIGRSAGFGGPFAAAAAPAMVAAETVPAFMGASLAGDVGAGVGQQAVAEATDNPIAQTIGGLVGGGLGSFGAAKLGTGYKPTPTLDDMAKREEQLWAYVKANKSKLTDTAIDDLVKRLEAKLPQTQRSAIRYPNAFAAVEDAKTLKNPTIYDVEEFRRTVGETVAADPKETRLGVEMKKAIDEYLAGLKKSDVSGADPTGAIEDLRAARETSARIYRAKAIQNKELRAERRAATSGSGGNEVNAKKQNIGALLDIERDQTLKAKRKGFTPEEIKQMERIAYGNRMENAARNLGKMAPTSGALPLMATGYGGAAGIGAVGAGQPGYLALPAIAGGTGMVAKYAAETAVQKHIDELVALILSGSKRSPSAARAAATRMVMEQLLSTGTQGPQ
jgi:hypothetical protein